MAALVIGMAELIGTTVGPQVELRLDLAAGLPMAVADPHQVEMALLNLPVNARDAMPDGGSLLISAHLQRTDHLAAPGVKPSDYVVVSVLDYDDRLRRELTFSGPRWKGASWSDAEAAAKQLSDETSGQRHS